MISKIFYLISTPNPYTHYFEVKLILEGTSDNTTNLTFTINNNIPLMKKFYISIQSICI